MQSLEHSVPRASCCLIMTVVCVCVEVWVKSEVWICLSLDVIKDKLADKRYHPPAVYSKVLDT